MRFVYMYKIIESNSSGKPVPILKHIFRRLYFSGRNSLVIIMRILLDNHINGTPVLGQDDRLLGIICQSDLIAQQKKLPIPTFFTFLESVIQTTSMKEIDKQVRKIAALTVSQAMSPDPVTVEPQALPAARRLAQEAAQISW